MTVTIDGTLGIITPSISIGASGTITFASGVFDINTNSNPWSLGSTTTGLLQSAYSSGTSTNALSYNGTLGLTSTYSGGTLFLANGATAGGSYYGLISMYADGTPLSSNLVGEIHYDPNYALLSQPSLVLALGSTVKSNYLALDGGGLCVSQNSVNPSTFIINTSTAATDYRGFLNFHLIDAAPGNTICSTYYTPSTDTLSIDTQSHDWSVGNSTNGRLYVQGGALYFQGGHGTITMIAPA